VLVVIGSTYLLGEGPTATPDGLTGRVAVTAARAGSTVELIDKIGDDPVGDALLVALARAGVGHVAVLRDAVHPTSQRTLDETSLDALVDPAQDPDPTDGWWLVGPGGGPSLEPADVGLALRYLTDYRVIVAVHPSEAVLTEAVTATDWAGAHLVVVVAPGSPAPATVPAASLVLEDDGAETDEGSSSLGTRLGEYAAAVDQGAAPATAYAALTAVAD